jgi:hypothetical protein
MSLVFSDAANNAGIVELIDETLKTDAVSYPIAAKVRDINLALDRALQIIFQSAGTWNFDDSNHTTHPIISTDLIAGQRDYSFVTDQEGSLILDFYKVFAADQNGHFYELKLRDVQSESANDSYSGNSIPVIADDIQGFTSGVNTPGSPSQYDMTGNSIFIDPVSSYNMRLVQEGVAGLKAYINRESTYFNVGDTSKKPGIAGIFHEYLALRPAWKYAQRNNNPVAGGTLRGGYKTGLYADVFQMEADMAAYYAQRERDGHAGLKMKPINFR